MDSPLIRVDADSPGLLRALSAYLEMLELHIVEPGSNEIPDIVVCPTSDCSPERSRGLVDQGRAVIVLAAVPRESERQRYLGAGAEYVPMTVDARPLLTAIARIECRRTIVGEGISPHGRFKRGDE